MRAVAELAIRSIGVVLGGFLTVNAATVLACFVGMARAAIHWGELLRVGNFLDIGMARHALECGVRRGLQSSSVERWRDAGLAVAGARAGVMTSGAILGFGSRALLGVTNGGKDDRGGGDPNYRSVCHCGVFQQHKELIRPQYLKSC